MVRKGEGGRGWGTVFLCAQDSLSGLGTVFFCGHRNLYLGLPLYNDWIMHKFLMALTTCLVCPLCVGNTHIAPSPSPFPFSHHGQASCSAACPWVRKGEGGRGWGSVFAAHTQWAAPVSCEGQQKIVHNSGIFVCQSDKHNSQTPRLPKKRGKCT